MGKKFSEGGDGFAHSDHLLVVEFPDPLPLRH
jgi:hypothetical protein